MNRAYGWTLSNTIIDAEAAVLREIAARLVDGESVRQIYRDLNARGLRTARGASWSGPAIKRTLTNPRVAGRVDGVPAILDEAVFDQVLALYADPERAKFTARRAGKPALLAGLMQCGRCDGPMGATTIGDGQPSYYRCSTVPSCGLAITQTLADREVTVRALARLADEDWRRQWAAATAMPTQQLREEIAAAEARQRVLATEFGAGRITRAALDAGLDAAQARIAVAETTRAMIDADLDALAAPDAVAAWWEAAAVERRRRALAAMLVGVRVEVATSHTVADRMRFEWRL